MLGPDYKVEASFGHIRYLPKSKMGFNLKTFVPEYIVPDDSEKHARTLRREAKAAEHVWLATDLDREGEAIAWHLADIIKVPKSKLRRVTFHEITPAAIDEAFKHPREIDQDLVDAQQARRVVDRLVGYTMSPLLWKKIRYGLSAGRVQSVALRLIVDREREITAFVPVEYWSLEAVLANHAGQTFTAEVIQHKGHKLEIHDGETAEKHRAALADAAYVVKSLEKRESGRNAAPPFTTSTLQQEASRKLGYSVKRTMVLAQQLYEGISMGASGSVGLITYMRTDSLHVAETALHQARDVVTHEFGAEYALDKPRHYKTRSKGAQEAHEAIRPTDLSRTPDRVKRFLKPEQLRLYAMIWQRTIASQMAPARFENTRLDVEAAQYVLRANGRRVLFDGFLRVYTEGTEEPEKEISPLPEVTPGEALKLLGLDAAQHFTQPPARFTEASLVKTLEEFGIGRPSTYAPTISTLVGRKYVRKEGRALIPEDVGFVVTDFLHEHFPEIVDTGFTARLEEDLDKIADGEAEGVPVGGRFGPFVGCTGYPDCKYIKKTQEKTGVVCPECGKGELVRRRGRGRSMFYGCERYPECTYTARELPAATPGKDAA